jgi:hypothetical protein
MLIVSLPGDGRVNWVSVKSDDNNSQIAKIALHK